MYVFFPSSECVFCGCIEQTRFPCGSVRILVDYLWGPIIIHVTYKRPECPIFPPICASSGPKSPRTSSSVEVAVSRINIYQAATSKVASGEGIDDGRGDECGITIEISDLQKAKAVPVLRKREFMRASSYSSSRLSLLLIVLLLLATLSSHALLGRLLIKYHPQYFKAPNNYLSPLIPAIRP